MKIRVEINRAEFTESIKSSIKSSYKVILPVCAAFAMFLTIVDGIQHGFKYPDSLENFLISFAIVLLIIIVTWIVKIYRILKKFKQHKSLVSTYTLYPEGIKLEKESGDLYFRWPEIRKVSLMSLYMVIWLTKGTRYIIPLSAFENKEQETAFFNAVQDGIATGKLTPPKHPSYWIGLLGLIPVIGLINGTIMLIRGLTTYRNKKYALIGLAGILFSFALFYITDNHKIPTPRIFREGFTSNVKMDLNSLVKEIEFYKLQHGVYPDSLRQIQLSGYINIFDPLIDDEKNPIYNYHKTGNKYTLFSSGMDEIPNTADDIYPTIDTTHTGLIVKRQ